MGLGGLLGGLGTLIERLGELAEKGAELKKSGEFRSNDPEGKVRGVYGFSIKTGLGGDRDEIKVEPFGNVRRDERTGEVVVREVREPLVDVFEEDDHVRVVAEMPGIDAEHVRVALRDDILTIDAGEQDKKYHKEVLLSGTFSADAMSHTCRNGVLEIRLER